HLFRLFPFGIVGIGKCDIVQCLLEGFEALESSNSVGLQHFELGHDGISGELVNIGFGLGNHLKEFLVLVEFVQSGIAGIGTIRIAIQNGLWVQKDLGITGISMVDDDVLLHVLG